MDLIFLLIIAVGLSIDVFSVSIGRGFCSKKFKKKFVIDSLIFGGFHFVMPFIGWLLGHTLRNFISGVDHWIAFFLLSYLGIRMIFDNKNEYNCKSVSEDILVGLATSVDAIVIGITLAFLDMPLFVSAFVIGISAFLFSLLGFLIGIKFSKYCGKYAGLIGGIVLISVGIKILIEHLFF